MKNKVIIVDNSMQNTGAFKSILGYASVLSPKIKFYFALNKKSTIKGNFYKSDIKVIPCSFVEIQKNINLIFYLPYLLYNTAKLIRYIKKNEIQIIHVNDIYNMVGVLVKIFRPKTYLIYHVRLLNNSYVSPLYNIWSFLIHKYSDKIICVSNIVAKSFPYESSKIIVLYDSIAPPKLNSDQNQRYEENDIKLYYIGNFIKGKGQDLAIMAYIEARKINSKLSLYFVGGTLGKKKNLAFKNALIKKVNEANLGNSVTFLDQSNNIEEYYKKADIVLNFSENESFSMVCLEALAYGKPLIATNSGGPAEIIDNELDGLLIPNKDINQMKEAILKLSSNQALRNKFIKNGPIKVKERFNIEESAKRLEDLYLIAILSFRRKQ